MRQWRVSLRRFDGTPVWVELSAYAVHNGQKKLLYYDGAIQDISDRVAVEKQIDDDETELRHRAGFERLILASLPADQRAHRPMIEELERRWPKS